MSRGLILAGGFLILMGLLWPWLSKLPLGRLPGDFRFERDGFSFYFPFTSGLVISAVILLLLWCFRR